ncbi:hypothetical protein [Novosphingobium sp.]|uniref:hypothetical protein n=1 Tax=Novosphingobium sp. TaxID=1874826 RepID=UPI0025CBFE2C|nr:hypothetical protein [Novosphingobium sp.]
MSAVSAQTIDNVAAAQWTQGGSTRSTSSNTVTINLAQPTVTIDTLALAPSGTTSPFAAPRCGGNVLNLPGGLGTSNPSATLQPTSSYRIGDLLFFQVTAPSANLDAAAVDSLTATLTTTAGDREVLTIYETGANTGLFLGAIQTNGVPPAAVQGDCRLGSAPAGQVTIAITGSGSPNVIATTQVGILADPFGLVFDSETGAPVNGARVSLVDAITGAPARVYADDGVTAWPSTVYSGQSVTDAAGNTYVMAPGEYRFPLAPLGQYRIVIEPPAPYTAPSVATPTQLSVLRRPDGNPMLIVPASFGGALTLDGPEPVRVDIPLDHPPMAVALTKTASRPVAQPGDAVFYSVTVNNPDPLGPKRGVTLVDTPSPWLRLRPDSIRIDGIAAPGAVQIAPDGRSFTLQLGDIPALDARTVTYAMTVRADAPAGQAENRVIASDDRGLSTTTGAIVRIDRQDLAARMTVIGRITAGGCAVEGDHPGIPGVRVVMEDGSFAITDADGRYHFDGVVPGSHVVQAQWQTLPKGGVFTDCTRSTRSAGSASSRFVIGQGGSLVIADFAAKLPEGTLVKRENNAEKIKYEAVEGKAAAKSPAQLAAEAAERAAAGADTDWLAKGDGPTEFLFPALDHNPRAPAIRVAIRHRMGQKVELLANGKPVDPLSFDGARPSPGRTFAVSLWRGIPLSGETTKLVAIVRDEQGKELTRLTRDVHFVGTPARVELLPGKSKLVADGSTRPVLALRLVDHNGRPVHAGLTGEFSLSSPYESAEAIDALQQRQLSGLGRQAPRWMVKGDDGIAYVELAPTMASGKLHMEFNFNDGQQRRRQELDAWIVPGDLPWTVVGLAEGTLGKGARGTVGKGMERTGAFDSDLGDHARLAFYAKGQVAKGLLLTASYDSAKQRDDHQLLGAIDPRAYYTVFADGSDRRHDAASRDKFYLRLESSKFYAMYGDVESGFDQTQLARYQRAATGLKGEVNAGGFHAQGFAAKVATTHRRDEFQGGGISGPYRLSSRAIIAGSEMVTIEVRDRFRSEVIVERRTLVRYVDYTIDLLAGTITFKEPVLSRDAQLNPQFIVIDYELDPLTAKGGEWNGGLRADVTTAKGALRIGASAISDTSSNAGTRTTLLGVDLKARLGQATELRAEYARSLNQGAQADAFLLELEHHSGRLDVLAYIRQAQREFGLGQGSGAELGRRKIGVDARVRITPDLSVVTSGWVDDSLTDGTRRVAVQSGLQWRTAKGDARIGLSHFNDRRADGSQAKSDVLEASVSRRFFDNKLELSAATSFALGKSASIDLPERHRFTARYSISPAVKLVGTYEIAHGDNIDARTGRIGVELAPWTGGRVTGLLGQQSIDEFGKRSFAAFGLSQSLPVTKNLTLDATLDSNRTLSGFRLADLVNPAHPASSSGTLGDNGALAEDFTAVTLGGTWRKDKWSATLRGELRDGELGTRKGATFGAIRQLGEGSMVGTGVTWTKAKASTGADTEMLDAAIAVAHRPDKSEFAMLSKVQFRSDVVHGAVAGDAGAAGSSIFTVNGDARSDRLIASLSADWAPRSKVDGQLVQRHNVGLFLAARHNFDRFESYDLSSTTLMGGLDLRYGIGDHFEIGAVGNVRYNLQDKTAQFSYGPQIGVSPAKDVLLLIGYNITGFRDPDFSALRNTDKGLFATIKVKFDADTFGFLGLGR